MAAAPSGFHAPTSRGRIARTIACVSPHVVCSPPTPRRLVPAGGVCTRPSTISLLRSRPAASAHHHHTDNDRGWLRRLLLLPQVYLFAVLGVALYSQNDPVEFGSVGIAALTLFRCATLADYNKVVPRVAP